MVSQEEEVLTDEQDNENEEPKKRKVHRPLENQGVPMKGKDRKLFNRPGTEKAG